MIVTDWRSTFRPTVIRRCTSAIASGVPITTALSPAARRVSPRGMKKDSPRRTATRSDPAGRCRSATRSAASGEPASSRYSSSRTAPSAKTSASMAPGVETMRSMSSASCASGHTTRSMPKCASPSSPADSRRKSSRDTKQIVRVSRIWVAIPQATMLTSSSPVQAMKTSARSMPARRSVSRLVPPPATNSTSSFSKRSAASAAWSTTTTSCLAASACERP